MSYKGTVKNGVVVLPPDVNLPEGAEVRVEPLELLPEQDPLIEAAKKVAKPRPHWPQGYSRNLDHYLYGVPKRVRQDKNWSVTDCTSFVVMRKHNLTEALTADRHFEQAGFKAILV